MISLNIYNQCGDLTGDKYSFDESEIAGNISMSLLHSAVVMYAANRRVGSSKSKSRAEVSGSSRKLYKQKGTGNARAGNKRTPVRRGGGHCFAKSPKEWRIGMPKAARRLATRMAFLSKLHAGRVFLVDRLFVSEPKTSVVANLISRLGINDKSAILTVSHHDVNLLKSCRNISRVQLSIADDLNAASILGSGFVVVTKDAMDSVMRISGR